LRALLDLRTRDELHSHPKLGASWEGFALEQTLAVTGDRNAYFWATQAGAELDLLWIRGPTRYGFEFKFADAPRTTRSMQHALTDLRLERLFIVHPGRDSHALTERIDALSIRDLPARLRGLAGQ
jgi:predicted AAA+ superfamily ATPase